MRKDGASAHSMRDFLCRQNSFVENKHVPRKAQIGQQMDAPHSGRNDRAWTNLRLWFEMVPHTVRHLTRDYTKVTKKQK